MADYGGEFVDLATYEGARITNVWGGEVFPASAVVVDSTAPVIANITPAPSGPLAATYAAARATLVEFDVTDLSPGLSAVLVSVQLEGEDEVYLAFDGTRFSGQFDDLSTVAAIANGFHFAIIPNLGWYKSIAAMFIYAVDSHGNLEALPI